MCGIAGYSNIQSGIPIKREFLSNMLKSITHRGPDDEGTYFDEKNALGNRRLSIIDIEGGHQPITNEDGSIVIVYNGELYNSPELREELIKKGHIFRTKSDTEVFVHLYEEEGIDFLKRLNGMFAFAMLDKRKNELVIARDRFGVKPFYYAELNNGLYFGSEIKTLKTLPFFDEEIDYEAMSIYLSLFFIPDPWTIYKKVRKLKSGNYLIVREDGIRIKEYADLDFSSKIKITKEEAELQTASLFKQAVKRQLLADVPVGVLLSGGMDSRAVLAAATEYNGATESFTITFSEELYNEGNEAADWSKVYNAKHHTMLYTEKMFCREVKNRQKHLDEPYGILCDTAMQEFAFFIKEKGFKVVLSGAGGDELFAGYPTLHAANAARYYRKLPNVLRKIVLEKLITSLPAGKSRLPLSFKLKSFVYADDPDIYRNFFNFKEVIRLKERDSFLTEDIQRKIKGFDPLVVYTQYADKLEGLELIDALSYLDFKVFLTGNLFMSGDNEFMAASVEQRVPFMDNDLVDFAFSLPVNIRFHPYKLKTLLRNSFNKYLKPPESAARLPQKYVKNGFEIPINNWLNEGCFAAEAGSLLSEGSVKRAGIFETSKIKKIMSDQRSGKQNNERVLQALISMMYFASSR
ncbi:asparagine synthase (glutamine-hydrolyzing) [soil metagenome]